MSKKVLLGGGARHASKSKNLKTFVALGLSSILPSLAFSSESNEALNQLLTTAPQAPSDSKTQKMENYSPVVDLRSSRAIENDGSIFNNNPVNITQDTVIGSSSNRWNVARNMQLTKASKNITIANNATLSIYALNNADSGYIFASTVAGMDLTWSGGNIVIDFQTSGWGGSDEVRGGIMANRSLFQINSNLDFTYREDSNSAGHDFRAQGVAAVGANYGGTAKFLGNRIKINAIGKENQNIGLGIFSLVAHDGGSIYLNAKDDGSANNQNAIVQLDGSISTGLAKNSGHYAGNGKIYANFTGGDSYLNGNIYSGRYNGGSKLVANFTNGASMTGEIVLLGDSTPTSQITFSNGSTLTGDINALSDGKHNITFDSSSFVGTIERNENEISGATIGGGTGNDIGTTLGTRGSGANTSVSFINTGGKVFGDGTNDIVASSYAGSIYGVFDVSANSSTIIKGSSDGSKGFVGSGTNALIFDFKGNARSNVVASKSFTIAGGNTNSIYTFSGMNDLNFTTLSGSDSVYAKIQSAGINIKADADTQATNNHIQGTLFFQKTNMTIGSNGLFSTDEVEKIVGSNNALNGLALGAMFGNATWNDANRDGVITANEIISNSGVNYKLENGKTPTESNEDANTSLGDIGSANDSIKKHIAFVFTKDTYLFGGGDEKDKADARYNKQGYSGTIRGGTTDSKYYFVNAGYVDRTQVDEAQGDLVLFNTALHGDLGVKNQTVNIMLDFSDGRRGLKAIGNDSDANIVGAGSKDVVFNFTGNTNVIKYSGAVVGNAEETSSSVTTADTDTAKYTMLNLAKYKYKTGNSGETILDGDGSLKISKSRAGASSTLIDAIQNAGLSGFNNPSANKLSEKNYGTGQDTTNTNPFSTTKTTLSLRGTSLDATNMSFQNYIYDFAFGEGIGELEGVAIQDSKLKGVIDLTATSATNTNSGHSFVFKGEAIDGEAGVLAGNGKLSGFSYDDSSANYSAPVTFQLSGLYITKSGTSITASSYVSNTASDKVKGDSLVFTQTNLEGDLWADDSVAVNLDFRDGRTWKMDSSGLFLKNGGNLIVHKEVAKNKGANTPTLQIAMTSSSTQQKIELINTGMQLKLLHRGSWDENTKLANTFTLRGTSLNTYWSNDLSGSADGLHGYADSGLNLVFAKGTNLDTTVTKTGGTNYKITDKELDNHATYGGTYSENGYTGNYIAESTLTTTKLVTRSVNAVFVGEGSYDSSGWGDGGKITQNATFTFANAGTDSSRLDGSKLKKLLSSNDATTTVTLEGTSLGSSGSGIVEANKGATTFNMTFIKGDSGTYISDLTNQYTDLARTTNAGGALKNSILKIAQSSLSGGINFQNSNFNVLFVGNSSQNLSGSNVFQGGTASSIVTFRDSNLNAGNGTSSISGIKGTIAFDLTHASEDMEISGTLGNMLGDGGKHQVQFTGRGSSADPVTINRLVFVNVGDIASSATLGKLDDSATAGQYFNDADTFGNLSQADYSDLALLAGVNDSASSSLTLANDATVALTSGEVVFVGANSHQFDASDSTANKLGNSTGGTLTFIDAGTLKVDNLINESSGTQGGSGTINLIGNTKIEKTTVAGTSKDTLTLYKSAQAKGTGITVNAVFSANNALADDNNQEITVSPVRAGTSTLKGASTYDIGQTDEETIYHLLFDYTSSNLTFGTHHAYTGNIYGLTSNSVIKFKNAGYIDGTQIANTDATILLDNTQLKADFRGDSAILDFRNGRSTIGGNILTSDVRATDPSGTGGKPTANVLSQKTITFDLTNETSNKLNYNYAIQAGYKVASAYTNNAQSVLTFQNAPTLSLGNDDTTARGTNTNPSDFIKALANDAGFSGIGSAETKDTNFASNQSKAYILEGTKLAFQGTNIAAGSGKTITENTYSLDLSFDTSATRGQTGLGETLNSSKLTANSIVMGGLNASNPLSLSLNFKGAGSLAGEAKGGFSNVLNIKLKDNAIFNLNAESSNGNIGTIILSENTATRAVTQPNVFNLNAQSSMTIAEGSMNFVGVFDTSSDATTQADNYGTLNLSFNGANKVYGIIAHKGDTTITLKGDALLSDKQAQALGYTKTDAQFANLVIDASVIASGKTLSLDLGHTSGLVGIIGEAIDSNVNSQSSFASINLAVSSGGNIAIKGAFDLGANSVSFTQGNQLTLVDNTYLKLDNGGSFTLTQDGLASVSKATQLYIDALGSTHDQSMNLTLTNLDPDIQVKLINNIPYDKMWGYTGAWNIRGTNINLDKVFWAEGSGNTIKMVFAKGEGRETTVANAENNGYLKLSELTTSDRINESQLTGSFASSTKPDGSLHQNGDGSSLLLKNASFTFIGKDSLGVSEANQRLDGSFKSGGTFKIGLYNTILKSGSILLDSSAWTNDSSRSISDQATIAGTDTFNLSVSKATVPTNSTGLSAAANNSTINAVYVNGSNLTKTVKTADTAITGNTYIDATTGANETLKTTLAQYATSNAGGALTSTELKTLQSKAYGNIKLDNTVTANMKFIGSDSHSFDGKILVKGSGTTAEFYTYVKGDKLTAVPNAASDYVQLQVQNGIVSKTSTNPSGAASDYHFATLSGGNDNSRFDFDHTSVKLDLIKDAGGRTYVYNSDVIGAINVTPTSPVTPLASAKPNTITPSTTLFFNAQMSESPTGSAEKLTNTAKSFIDSQFKEGLGINLDLSTAHTLQDQHLTAKKLAATSKQTNLVLIGKGSITANNAVASNDAIDLSWLPDSNASANYAYTIISGGMIDSAELTRTGSDYEVNATVFGNSKVQLVDTYVIGARNFAQVGFINTNLDYNQKSSWGGDDTVEQYLIFDMGGEAGNKLNENRSGDVITNTSDSSHYIFSNLKTKELTFATSLKDTLNTAMSGVAPTSRKVIADTVAGTLGLRGVSVKGNIAESTNNLDIVFNSTSSTDASQGIAYKEWFDTNNNHQSEIVSGEKNLVSHGTDYTEDPNISGYAVLMSSDATTKKVSISGSKRKTITFIGDKAVNGEVGGFEKLSIDGGTVDSAYTFHTVGTLSDGFLTGAKLQGTTRTTPEANLGTFTFINSTITGNINANTNSSDTNNSNNEARLVFDNVAYSGTISGSLIKNLKFGKGSGHIIIDGGSEYSVYDFSNLAGSSVHLDINMKDSGTSTYLAPTITGFDGDVSLVGSINLAKTELEISGNSNQTNSFVFSNSASWTMTGNSRVMSLTLNNSGSNYNLDLASAPRTESVDKDLRVLEIGNLYANGGQVLLGTVINTQEQSKPQSDKIKANVINQGTLYVTAQDASLKSGSFATDGDNAIVLVSANSAYGEVKGAQRKQGLSYAITELEHQITVDNINWIEATQENIATANEHRWVLAGFDNQTNQELVDESAFVISNPYRMLMIETNNLNKRMGELRDNEYNQGSWIRVFNGMDSGEGAKNLYTNIQLGYDYGISAIGAKNYTGVAFSTSIVDIDGDTFNGKSNTYSLAVYDSYIADNGLYVDTIAKYLYTDQKLSLNGTGADSSFGNHAGSLGIEFGYRAYVASSNFYFEPQAELIAGVIAGVKDVDLGVVGGLNVMGELQTTFALNSRIGLVQGYTLKTESGFVADFRLGVSALNEYVSNENPIQLYDSVKTVGASMGNDTKLVLNVGTNLILTDQWRVYVDVEKSFLGKRNTDYQANVGARFSFGEKISSKQDLEKPMPLKLKSEENKDNSEEKKEDKSKNQEQSKASETKTEDKSSKKEAKK